MQYHVLTLFIFNHLCDLLQSVHFPSNLDPFSSESCASTLSILYNTLSIYACIVTNSCISGLLITYKNACANLFSLFESCRVTLNTLSCTFPINSDAIQSEYANKTSNLVRLSKLVEILRDNFTYLNECAENDKKFRSNCRSGTKSNVGEKGTFCRLWSMCHISCCKWPCS